MTLSNGTVSRAVGGGIFERIDMATLPGNILHSDGQKFSGVRTARGDELFGVGFEITPDGGSYIANAFHYDGTSWTKAQLERAPIDEHRYFTKVLALAPGEAIAVGYGGIAYYFAGNTWTRITNNVTADLMGVWGTDTEHVWSSGAQGTLLKWQRSNPGVAVSDPSLTTADDLGVIHGAGGVAWIAAARGDGVLRGSATSGWTKISTPFSADGLFAIDEHKVVISSGSQSTVARWNGSAFVVEDNASASPTPGAVPAAGRPAARRWPQDARRAPALTATARREQVQRTKDLDIFS